MRISFKSCTLDYLERTFQLQPTFELSALNEWLQSSGSFNEFEKNDLLQLQKLTQLNVLHWNEQELSLHLIGPMINLANLSSLKFNVFAQRYISATVEGITLSGKPDGILASGYRAPHMPYFAFQEYKKEQDPNGEPAGQALAAMLVGQALNADQQPIYGCYISGRDWYFMTLDGQQYAISQGFDAATEHIFDILRILKALRPIVLERLS